ncbi:MAG TPA: alpha/beta hydrolase [Chloroflexota bacterium]|jgi:acetyl esterase/lipase
MSNEALERLNAALRTVKQTLGPNVPIAEMRAIQAKLGRPAPPDTVLQPIDAGGVPAEWVTVPTSGNPVVLYLHGGAYTLGSIATAGEFGARLARAASARVLLPEYRLAPEHLFPAALEDAITAYRYLLGDGVAPERVVIAGGSAGGGLTLAALVALRDAGDPLPAAAVTISAWTDLALTGESISSRAHLDVLDDRETLAAMAETYLGGADARDPRASPLYADLTGLPPLRMLVGTAEILYDDTVRLATRARSVGVDVTVEEGPDLPHCYPLFAAMLPEGQQAIERIGEFIHARTAAASVRG